MKVVKVNLALRLEFVEKIEKTKREHSAGPMPGGRKPTDTKELSATATGPPSITISTEAVGDPNRVDAGSVEEYEVSLLGGKGTLVVDAVTKLIGCA